MMRFRVQTYHEGLIFNSYFTYLISGSDNIQIIIKSKWIFSVKTLFRNKKCWRIDPGIHKVKFKDAQKKNEKKKLMVVLGLEPGTLSMPSVHQDRYTTVQYIQKRWKRCHFVLFTFYKNSEEFRIPLNLTFFFFFFFFFFFWHLILDFIDF